MRRICLRQSFAHILTAAAVFALWSGAAVQAQSLPNGVASGDTTQTSSILWTHSTALGPLSFEYSTNPTFVGSTILPPVNVVDPTLPVKVDVTGLNPGTEYFYRATNSAATTAAGKFRTPQAAGSTAGVRFGVSGDWRGELGSYPAVANVPARNLDLFVALGDTIYADFPSPDVNVAQAATLAQFRAKHNEVYKSQNGSNTLRDLRQSTSVFSNIDDHEVTDDFAGGALAATDPRFGVNPPGTLINKTSLFDTGLQAFNEYNPIREQTYIGTGETRFDGESKLYRNQNYGSTASVFVVDQRTFRDAGLTAGNPLDPVPYLVQSFTPGRTLLGATQLTELQGDLLAAQTAGVTWKFVMLPEPIQNLGVLNASDRFEGYAFERSQLLGFIDSNNIQNVVFVAADIHGTLVNNINYQTGPGQPQLPTGAFEITTGSVAFAPPFGPSVLNIAGTIPIAPGVTLLDQFLLTVGGPGFTRPMFDALPRAVQDGALKGLVDQQIVPLGYSPIGLEDSGLDVDLVTGGYAALNTFGWTEFDIDSLTQALTVTTYGVDWYDAVKLAADPTGIMARQPQIVSQFVVNPVPEPSTFVLAFAFATVGGMFAARRRWLAAR